MKLVFVAAIGLGAGLLGGTGVVAVKVRNQVVEVREKAVADSVAAVSHEAASPSSPQDDGGNVVLPVAPQQPTDTAVSQDTPAAPAVGDSVVVPPAGAGDIAVAGDAAVAPKDDSTAIPLVSTADGTSSTGPAAKPVSEEGAKKLARIFTAMKPADAAKVLSEMTDEEVTSILLYMNSRQAGQVVGSLDPDRAATLSRVLLGATASTKGGA